MAGSTNVRRIYLGDFDSFADAIVKAARTPPEQRHGMDEVGVGIFVEKLSGTSLYLVRATFVQSTRGTKGKPREIVECARTCPDGLIGKDYSALARAYADELLAKLCSTNGDLKAERTDRGLRAYSIKVKRILSR